MDKEVKYNGIENLPLFPEGEFIPKKKNNFKALKELNINFSNSYFIFGGPIKETKELVWKKEFGNFSYYLEGSKDAGGLPYGTYYRFLQFYVDTQIMLSKKGKGDIKFKQVGNNKIPYIEFADSMRGIAKTLGIDPSGRNLKSLAKQFERFTSCKIILEVKDTETGKIQREKKSIFPGVLEIWKDDTKTVLEKSLFQIDLVYYEHVCRHGQPLIPEILHELKKSSTHLDFYRFISYRYNSGFKHSVNLDELADFFGISKTKLSLYFTDVLENIIKPLYEKSKDEPLLIRIQKGKNRYEPGKIIFAPQKFLKK